MLKDRLLKAEDSYTSDVQSEFSSQTFERRTEAKEILKRKGFCHRFWDKLVDKFNATFFRQFNKYFGDDYEKVCSNSMKEPVNPNRSPMQALKNFESSWKDCMRSKLKGTKEEVEEKLAQIEKDIDRPIPLMAIIFNLGKRELIWSLVFKILEQMATLTIPFIMKGFIDNLVSPVKTDVKKLLIKCCLVAIMTFWIEVWKHLSTRWSSAAKTRAVEGIKSMFFMKMTETNIEFLTLADTSYISKMIVHELKPISQFILSSVKMLAAMVSIPYALVVLFYDMPIQKSIVVGYLAVAALLLAIAHYQIKHYKRKYSSLGSMVTGQIEQFTKFARFIRINSLQNIALRGIWTVKSRQFSAFWKVKLLTIVFEVLFQTPVLVIFFMVAIDLRRNSTDTRINESSLYQLVGLTNSIKNILANFSTSMLDYQNFKPSLSLYKMFFSYVSRTPGVNLLKLPGSESEPPVWLQAPTDHQEDLATLELPSNLSIKFSKCKFFDKSLQAKKVLAKVFKESKGPFDYKRGLLVDRRLGLPVENLEIEQGMKVCVMGKIDQNYGPQFFFDCLSNEHELSQGKLYIRGKVNHFDMNRFELLDETFIENIVLDEKIKYRRLFDICKAVGLEFSRLNGGRYGKKLTNPTMTEIDKIRILLARALYSEFDIFVISSLFEKLSYDARLTLFDSLISNHLNHATVIYHSNDAGLAEKSDLVIVIKDGRIVETGKAHVLAAQINSAYNQVISSTVTGNQATLKNLDAENHRIELNSIKASVQEERLNMYGVDSKSLDKIIAHQESQKTSKFCNIALVIICLHRISKNYSSKRKARTIVEKSEQILCKSTYASFMKFVTIRSCFAPWKINLTYFLFALIMLLESIWIGWWADNFLEFSTDEPYLRYVIALKVVLTLYIIVKNLVIDNTTIGFSSKIFFSTLKKLVRCSVRWIELMSIQQINYNVSSYQRQVDIELSDLIYALANSVTIITIGLIIANFFYPGMFLVVTILLLWYGRSVMKTAIRSQRIVLNKYLGSMETYYNYMSHSQIHAVSMRHIGQSSYLLGKLQEAGELADRSANVVRHARRYVQHRTAYISAMFVFCIYAFTIVMLESDYLEHQYGFKQNIWMIGIMLTWSRQMVDQLSAFMNILSRTFIFSEIGERLLELQKKFSIHQLHNFMGELVELGDEITDKDLVKVFDKKYNSPQMDYKRDLDLPVIKIEQLTHIEEKRLLLSNINISIRYEDKIAMIQNQGTSTVDTLLNIIMGFRLPLLPTSSPSTGQLNRVEIFGKNIQDINRLDLRRNMFLLEAQSPLFVGSFRDNIDPSQIMNDDIIVKILHYLGFMQAYRRYVHVTSISDMKTLVSTMMTKSIGYAYFNKMTSIDNDDSVIDDSSISLTDSNNLIDGSNSLIDDNIDDTSRATIDRPAVVKNRRLVVAVKAGIRANRLLAQTRIERAYIHKVTELDQEIIDEIDDSRHDVDICRRMMIDNRKHKGFTDVDGSDMQPTKMYGYLNDRLTSAHHMLTRSGTLLGDYEVIDSDEKAIIGKILNCTVAYEDRQAPVNLRRIIWMTRAILTYPEILIVEEDALLIDGANPRYLDAFFEYMKHSTVICKATSHQLVDRFSKHAFFEDTRLVDIIETQRNI